MRIKAGVNIAGLKIEMRAALKAAESSWKARGRKEGVTVTCGLNGVHSAGSYHYYGYAVDLRTWYFSKIAQIDIARGLRAKLNIISPFYDVVVEFNHMHIEFDYERSLMPIP